MLQRLTRQKYYGEVEDGTPIVILDNTEWYLALLKNRDSFYFMVSYDGHIRYNGQVPRYAEFYFPNGFDIIFAKMLTERKNEEDKEIKRNKTLYKIKTFLHL